MTNRVFTYAAVLFFALFSFQVARSQIVDSAQFPPDVAWKQMLTPHFQVLFPEEIEHDARRVATKLEALYPVVSKSLSVRPSRIPILLSNRTATSNGFVTLAPRRSEWEHLPAFPTYSDFLGVSEWFDLLAVHEFRHVAQLAKLDSGMARIAKVIAGEYGLSVATSAAAPPWFREGDAVGIESALTYGGRGRIPQFDMHIRALSLEGIRYPYAKAHHRSYKDWYPSHYPLGYFLTTYVRRTFGAEAWSKILDESARRAFVPFAFSTGLKNITGKGTGGIYDATMTELDSLWNEQNSGRTLTTVDIVSPSSDRWTNYLYPHLLEDGSILTLKYGLEDAPTWCLLNTDGTQISLGTADPSAINFGFDYALNRIVWNSDRPDIRYGKADKSEIRILDLATGTERTIDHVDPLFIPAFSKDGLQLAAVSYLPSRKVALVILNAESGEEKLRFPFTDYDFISSIAWSRDDSEIAFVFHQNEGKGVAIVDLDSGNVRAVLPTGQENPLHLDFFNDHIYYSSSYSGVDELYVLSPETRERFRILSPSIGAFHPDVSEKEIVYNDYGISGYAVGKIGLEQLEREPVHEIQPNNLDYFEPLIEQEDDLDLQRVSPDTSFVVTPFSSIQDRMKWHSWFPFADDREIGIQLDARNLLNTRGSSTGLLFDRNEHVLHGFGQLRMARKFPVVDISVDHGFRAQRYATHTGEEIVDRWRETRMSAGVFVPMNLSRSKVRRNATAGVYGTLVDLDGQVVTAPFENGDGRFLSMTYQIGFRRSLPSAASDFRPRSAQVFRFLFRHTPFASDFNGLHLAASTDIYLPGWAPHHSLLVSGTIEFQRPDMYRYSSLYTLPRGYSYRYDDTIWKIASSYAFPLIYPDAGISTLVYVKRLRASVFADYGLGLTDDQKHLYRSAGVEVFADSRFLDIPSEVSLGVRASYRIDDNAIRFDPLINFSL